MKEEQEIVIADYLNKLTARLSELIHQCQEDKEALKVIYNHIQYSINLPIFEVEWRVAEQFEGEKMRIVRDIFIDIASIVNNIRSKYNHETIAKICAKNDNPEVDARIVNEFNSRVKDTVLAFLKQHGQELHLSQDKKRRF